MTINFLIYYVVIIKKRKTFSKIADVMKDNILLLFYRLDIVARYVVKKPGAPIIKRNAAGWISSTRLIWVKMLY